MSRFATRAELTRLGRALDIAPDKLRFLEDVAPEQLRELRDAVYELLFTEDRDLFVQLATVAGLLPNRLGAILGERLLNPLVAARLMAELPSGDVVEMTKRMSIAFRADVCAHLDPRRVRDVIRKVPIEYVIEVAQELVKRGDFVTMGRFVDFFPDEAILEVEKTIEDEEALLRGAFYMESKNSIDHIFRMLPEERVQALFSLIADESQDLIPEFLFVLIHVGYGLKRQLGDLMAAQDESVLIRYMRTVQDEDLWAEMLPVVAASDALLRRMAQLDLRREPDVASDIIRAADERQLWAIVLSWVAMTNEANREVLARALMERTSDTFSNAIEAALMRERWEPLLDLVQRMPPAEQFAFVKNVRNLGDVDPGLVDRVLRRAEAHGVDVRSRAAKSSPT